MFQLTDIGVAGSSMGMRFRELNQHEASDTKRANDPGKGGSLFSAQSDG